MQITVHYKPLTGLPPISSSPVFCSDCFHRWRRICRVSLVLHLDHTRTTPMFFIFVLFKSVISLNNSLTWPLAISCDLGFCMLPLAHSILVTVFLKQARVIHISWPLNFPFLLLGVIFTNKWLLSFCCAPGT